jgi:hypothetical protein
MTFFDTALAIVIAALCCALALCLLLGAVLKSAQRYHAAEAAFRETQIRIHATELIEPHDLLDYGGGSRDCGDLSRDCGDPAEPGRWGEAPAEPSEGHDSATQSRALAAYLAQLNQPRNFH